MNPKEIAEKYEKPRMQMLELKKQKSVRITRQMVLVTVLVDAIVMFQ